MAQLKFLVALLSAVVTLPIGSTARECYVDGTDKGRFHSLLVKTYPQLNQFKGCTTLIGSLDIAPTFSGDLELRGVKNVTGSISVFGALEEISLPDLEYIGEVTLFERHRVKRLLLPRVTRVKALHISQPRGFFFDLGFLTCAEAISLDGPWSRISFPSLEHVELKLSFDTQLPWASKGYPRDPAPIDIELPALRRVGGLSLEGDIRSLSTPKLEAIVDGGLRVSAQQADLPAVDMPSLKSLDTRLSLWGRISR
ncbi:hypothetical protein ASPCAL03292 [Aspergillus calidoustus]|uniref:Uncharacterized protein n=1 Tax=Aspergillus calidoustus TaxID=454130 RepID=A0A0U5FVL9_ASPCI|nr:hypothetical protein ASPCAL03292 [Aspergillus calidoustus]